MPKIKPISYKPKEHPNDTSWEKHRWCKSRWNVSQRCKLEKKIDF
jgi:hypothetical protein